MRKSLGCVGFFLAALVAFLLLVGLGLATLSMGGFGPGEEAAARAAYWRAITRPPNGASFLIMLEVIVAGVVAGFWGFRGEEPGEAGAPRPHRPLTVRRPMAIVALVVVAVGMPLWLCRQEYVWIIGVKTGPDGRRVTEVRYRNWFGPTRTAAFDGDPPPDIDR